MNNETISIEKEPSLKESFEKLSTFLEGHMDDTCILVPDHYEGGKLMGLTTVKGPDFYPMDSQSIIDTVKNREIAEMFYELAKNLDKDKYHKPTTDSTTNSWTNETIDKSKFVLKDLMNDILKTL